MLRMPVKKIAIMVDYNSSHPGIDFGWVDEENKKVYSAGDGTVIFAGKLSSTGEIDILIYHPLEKCITIYGHLSKLLVKKGDKVSQGDYIGYMGNTGISYGIHLHFEIWKGAPSTTTFPSGIYTNRAKYKVDPLSITYCYDDQQVLKGSLKYGVKYIKGTPVERNTQVDQIQINTNVLNCRNAPNGVVLGYIQKGIYNVLSTEAEGDYVWQEVEEDKWIAFNKSWAKLLPKQESELELLKKENATLKTQNANLTTENTKLKKVINQINTLSKI